jgi:hypothetical protein
MFSPSQKSIGSILWHDSRLLKLEYLTKRSVLGVMLEIQLEQNIAENADINYSGQKHGRAVGHNH